jgi:pimeloyl-ACP methyl ester carboxylesterase
VTHIPVALEGNKLGFGLLSTNPEIAVIFVHGFEGDPRTTWADFVHLVDEHGSQRGLWNSCDLLFYGYESHDQIIPLAEKFYAFLNGGFRPKFNIKLPSSLTLSTSVDGAASRSSYKQIVLVGHSTGALIIREAILQYLLPVERSGGVSAKGIDSPISGPMRLLHLADLRFFAPAHCGVIAAGKLGLARSLPVIGQILGAYLRSNPLYQNLSPMGSFIQVVRKETERLYTTFQLPALKAVLLFGEHEEIVEIGGYRQDEYYDAAPGGKRTEPGQAHVSICKPSYKFMIPLQFVAKGFTAKVSTSKVSV